MTEKRFNSHKNTRSEIIRTENVTKRFGELVAVDDVNYSLDRNEIAGIVGSNGAGKTTFFNLLTGYHIPDEGSVFYEGQDITELSPQQRVSRGIMRTFQLTSTFDNLSVVNNLILSFFRAHEKSALVNLLLTTLKRYLKDERINQCLDAFELRKVADREVKHLALGEKRRLEIAMAILAEPKVLLLDEPLAGLSESEISEVLVVLRHHAHKKTILIVEHKISKVQDFLERLTVMHDGKIIADGTCQECLANSEVRKSYWQLDFPSSKSGT
jgi:branched-chain amino acid transport system ATP-binding protein